jgi:DNA invertase Pin-like site-specific DNA recombinase
MEAGVNFVAADFRRLTVHILTAATEHEAKMISERTKATLAAAKPRGVKLGGNRGVGANAAGRRPTQTTPTGAKMRQQQANFLRITRNSFAVIGAPWR